MPVWLEKEITDVSYDKSPDNQMCNINIATSWMQSQFQYIRTGGFVLSDQLFAPFDDAGKALLIRMLDENGFRVEELGGDAARVWRK